ncbi:RluA family pseudouridine synthase [Paenibacillus sp. y28]|uniref:RluA family pseudouridine synthase n=1 Tax=Paenibacillus sp. y28 TaxID=3129110 RepID=UPI003015F8CB
MKPNADVTTDRTAYYEPLVYKVPAEDDGVLLRTIIQRRLGVSRKLLSRLKLTERGIMLNGARVYINVQVSQGDTVELRMEREQSEDILPQPMELHILYEDEHLLVLAKPSGIIVHPTHGHYTGTIANGVVHHWLERGEEVRFRPIHRLDQETSGVLAIAKTAYVHQNISEQMQQGLVEKEYAAFVYGVLSADAGTVNAPIDRNPASPHERIVMPEGEGYPSVTHYRVLRRYAHATLVALRLETGRTHQIRVHMKHLGHPLIGDKLYVPAQQPVPPEWEALDKLADRHALHAVRLAFAHPMTKEYMSFTAPLPEDLARLEQRLEAGSCT